MSESHKAQSTYSPFQSGAIESDNTSFNAFSGVSSIWDFFGLHCHDFYEFYLFTNGMPYFCVDEQVFPLKPYTLIILPPFHLHGLVSDQPTKDYDRSWLYVTPAVLQKLGLDHYDFADFFKQCMEEGKAYFYIDEETGKKLKHLIELVVDGLNDKDPIDKWKSNLYVSEFLSIVHDIASTSEIKGKPIILNETTQAVLAYINNNYTEDLSLASIAKEFGLSTSYLSRSFSAYTGRSIYDYIIYRRIMLAKEMICSGKPFSEVALECGFNDYSCFLRSFAKSTGSTPREYKKHMASIGFIK